MKKILLTLAIILPFFWGKPHVKAQAKPAAVQTVSVWEKVVYSITNTAVYRGMENLLHKLMPF